MKNSRRIYVMYYLNLVVSLRSVGIPSGSGGLEKKLLQEVESVGYAVDMDCGHSFPPKPGKIDRETGTGLYI